MNAEIYPILSVTCLQWQPLNDLLFFLPVIRSRTCFLKK